MKSVYLFIYYSYRRQTIAKSNQERTLELHKHEFSVLMENFVQIEFIYPKQSCQFYFYYHKDAVGKLLNAPTNAL